uniref:Protein sleepless n=1 Tax=Stomoxys calcitrans TaxID=35570 RepID=A0A1I8P5N0_STOCA
MPLNMKLMIFSVFMLTAVSKIKADETPNAPLQCWHCSSDTAGAENFCGEEFSEDSIPWDLMKERNLSAMRSCSSTIKSEHERPVCRKTIEEINGKTVVKRFCYYTNKSDTLNHCMDDPTEKNVRRVFCEDCLTEKCNGATMMGGNVLTSLFAAMTAVIAVFIVQKI